MQDIVQKVERVKSMAIAARAKRHTGGLSEEELAELFEIGVDIIGEMVANGRRIACALERIAEIDPDSAPS